MDYTTNAKTPGTPTGQLVENVEQDGELYTDKENVEGGSCTQVPLGTERGRCEVEAPRKTRSASQKRTSKDRMKKEGTPKTVDIRLLGEDDLLNMIRSCVTTMLSFVDKNRNVHKEIKDLVTKTDILLKQFLKVKPACTKKQDIAPTRNVGQDAQNEFSETIAAIKVVLEKQNEAIGKLSTQTELIRQQQQQHQQLQQQQQRVARQGQGRTNKNLDNVELHETPVAEQKLKHNREKIEQQKHSKQEKQQSKHIYSTQKQPRQQQEPKEAEVQDNEEDKSESSNSSWTAVARKKKRKTVKVTQEAVIIKVPESSTYAAVLRDVKKSLDTAGLAGEVDTARKTFDGSLLIRMKKQTTKTAEISETAKNVLGIETQIKKNMVAVEIRDLDEGTTKEEIASYITKDMAIPLSTHDIKTLKPSFGGKMMAVVLLSAQAANRIVNGPRIKINWASCRTSIRVPMIRCFRCLEFGHRRFTCKGPDRSNVCKNCWETGHQRKDCQAEAYCGLCREDGNDEAGHHFSGGGKCQAFKRFLNEQKQK